MSKIHKKVVEINFDRVSAPSNYSFSFGDNIIKVETHHIGSAKRLGERMIHNLENDTVDIILTAKNQDTLKKLSATPSRNRIYRGRVVDNLKDPSGVLVERLKKLIQDETNLPDTSFLSSSFAELLLDYDRMSQYPDLTLETFSKTWMDKHEIFKNRKSPKEVRCGFIVHPLAFNYLMKLPPLKPLKYAPQFLQDFMERQVPNLPGLKVGEISEIESEFDGTKVHCDVYGVWATPKEFSVMAPDKAYKMLQATVAKAKKNGASICGLGAFTKVVGDSGVSVHKMSDIPVTTGNSLSAAATLWSAREMVDQMGFIPRDETGRWAGKVMVVGATGSIGKTCVKVLAAACESIVLVAPNPSKLELLKKEVEEIDSKVEVIAATSSYDELPKCDVIITATSVYEGSIFDMNRLKPGALVVECSRPLNISKEEAASRPDVLVINSGEVTLPGENVKQRVELALPKGTVYACLAETILLALEGLYEPFSLSRDIPWKRVKQVYALAKKHGVRLAPIDSVEGFVTEEKIRSVVKAAKASS